MASKNKQPDNLIGFIMDPDIHPGVTVISVLVMLVAGALLALSISIASDYLTAEYKETVTSKVIDVRQTEKEDWEYAEEKQEGQRPEQRETRIVKYTLYTVEWEYEINGEKQTYTTSDKYLSDKKVGDTEKVRLISDDGVTYTRNGFGTVNMLFIILSGAFTAVGLFVFVMSQIGYILSKNKKKRKKKRR